MARLCSGTHLVVPLVPRLCDEGLDRGELLVGHVECAEEVLLEERRAGEGEEESGGEHLSADHLVLGEGRLVWGPGEGVRVLEVVREDGVVGIVGLDAVRGVVEAGHKVVPHVEAELTELLLLDEGAVLALALASGGAHALAAGELVGGEACADGVVVGGGRGGGRGRVLLLLLLEGLRVLLLLLLMLLLLLLLLRVGMLLLVCKDEEVVVGVAVTLALAALPLCSLLAFLPLARRLVLARALARRRGHWREQRGRRQGLCRRVHQQRGRRSPRLLALFSSLCGPAAGVTAS